MGSDLIVERLGREHAVGVDAEQADVVFAREQAPLDHAALGILGLEAMDLGDAGQVLVHCRRVVRGGGVGDLHTAVLGEGLHRALRPHGGGLVAALGVGVGGGGPQVFPRVGGRREVGVRCGPIDDGARGCSPGVVAPLPFPGRCGDAAVGVGERDHNPVAHPELVGRVDEARRARLVHVVQVDGDQDPVRAAVAVAGHHRDGAARLLLVVEGADRLETACGREREEVSVRSLQAPGDGVAVGVGGSEPPQERQSRQVLVPFEHDRVRPLDHRAAEDADHILISVDQRISDQAPDYFRGRSHRCIGVGLAVEDEGEASQRRHVQTRVRCDSEDDLRRVRQHGEVVDPVSLPVEDDRRVAQHSDFAGAAGEAVGHVADGIQLGVRSGCHDGAPDVGVRTLRRALRHRIVRDGQDLVPVAAVVVDVGGFGDQVLAHVARRGRVGRRVDLGYRLARIDVAVGGCIPTPARLSGF